MMHILLFFILILLSGFFSGSETAFFSLGKVRLEKFKKKNRKALQIEKIKSRPDYLLSILLLGNMFVNIAFSSLIAVIFIDIYPETGVFISILVSSLLILIFGEILPKGMAFSVAESFALFSSYVIKFLQKIIFPLSFIIIHITQSFMYLVFRRNIKEEDVLTEEELKEALEIGKAKSFIDEEEQDMIHSILEFSEVEASEIMTPRVDVKAIDIKDSPEEIEADLKEITHSYVPIYNESIDNLAGIMRTKDYFLKKSKTIQDVIRQPIFIPETKLISDLLKEMISQKEKMVLVMDEYGGFSGLITLEDIQEEIFGEIYDEYEVPFENIKKISKHEFLVNPRISIKDLNYELNLNIPEEEGILSGFLLNLIKYFPQEGEEISFGKLVFRIERATKKKILLIKLKI